MDEHEELLSSVALLLMQTRFARRALEDIERATAAYAGFAFTSVIGAGRRFGEPPLVDGALKVHIVNISDLGPGGGFGALIEGLLGGAGRFVGNLFGGIIGGTISSRALIQAIPTINELAGKIERILTMLGVGTPAPPTGGRGGQVGGSNLITQLASIERAVNGLTGLFLASGGQPEAAAGTSDFPSTPQGERWQRLLITVSDVLGGIGRVVDGLIIGLPIAVGSIASLIFRLGDIRVAIAETLQFAIRNALLLRGVLTVTLFDALALVARLAARVVEVLATTLSGMIGAVFDTVQEVLLAVLALGAVLGDAIKTTIDALLAWIVPTIDLVLRNFGDLRAFRVVTHIVRILPAIIPPIFELVKDRPLPGSQQSALQRAGRLPFLDVVSRRRGGAGAPPTTGTLPPQSPDIAAIFTDPALVGRFTGALDRIEQVTGDGLQIVGDTAQQGLQGLGQELDRAAREESQLSTATLDRYLGQVQAQSATLAESVIVGEAVRPQTGLEAIAQAYESWLSDRGLDTLLSTITTHFQTAAGQTGVPQRIVEGSLDRPRATIQIDEVVIEVEDPLRFPPPEQTEPGDYPLPPEGDDDVERFFRALRDHRRRGGRTRHLLPI